MSLWIIIIIIYYIKEEKKMLPQGRGSLGVGHVRVRHSVCTVEETRAL
jgi:hypothetical protein